MLKLVCIYDYYGVMLTHCIGDTDIIVYVLYE